MGVDALIMAFVVVVIGGLGSLEGALVGALLVGVVRELGVTFFPQVELAVLYLMAAVGLLVPPPALFRRPSAPSPSPPRAPPSAPACAAVDRPGPRHPAHPAGGGRAVSDHALLVRARHGYRGPRLQPAPGLHGALVLRALRLLRRGGVRGGHDRQVFQDHLP